MKQNITGSYNYSSLINCPIFNQGMTHLIKVTGGIGRVNPIFCVPVGGNPALVKVLLINSLSLCTVSVNLRRFFDNKVLNIDERIKSLGFLHWQVICFNPEKFTGRKKYIWDIFNGLYILRK